MSFLLYCRGVTLILSYFSFLSLLQPSKGCGERDCCGHLHWGCPGEGQSCAVNCDEPGGINCLLCEQMHQQDIPAGTLVGFSDTRGGNATGTLEQLCQELQQRLCVA